MNEKITKYYLDSKGVFWKGPLYSGDEIFFARADDETISDRRPEPDPSWTETSWKAMDSIERLNKYLNSDPVTPQVTVDTLQEVRARYVAVRAHVDQTRWNGDPYVTHPIRVAAALKPPTDKAVAYLHDVVEDTELTLDDLRKFGFSEAIIIAVDALTKRDGESYLDFILRCMEVRRAVKVKIADINDNLRDMPKKNKSMRDKYQLALWILENTGDYHG